MLAPSVDPLGLLEVEEDEPEGLPDEVPGLPLDVVLLDPLGELDVVALPEVVAPGVDPEDAPGAPGATGAGAGGCSPIAAHVGIVVASVQPELQYSAPVPTFLHHEHAWVVFALQSPQVV